MDLFRILETSIIPYIFLINSYNLIDLIISYICIYENSTKYFLFKMPYI